MDAPEWSGDDLVEALLAPVEPAFAGGVVVVTSPPTPSPRVPQAVARLRVTPSVVVAAPHPDEPALLTDLVDATSSSPADLDAVLAGVARAPVAAQAAAGLLRMSEHMAVEDGLLVESAVFSALQSGPEHQRWLARRGDPGPPGPRRPRVSLRRDGQVVEITLCRPEAANALDAAMRDELLEALAVVEADRDVRGVLRAEGAVFCAGGDLAEFGSTPDPATAHLVRVRRSLGAVLHRVGPRVTVLVQGDAIGSGLELAAFAGSVVAHPAARFALPELALGLVPGAGGTVSVVRRIGRHRTAWMLFTGQAVDAATAASWGLVDAIGAV